jgi:hypothetical protein
MGSFNEKGNGMNYTLSIPIDAPTMTRAQAIAWSVLKLLPSGTAFAIKAQPPAEGGQGDPPPAPEGRTWTPAELRDIEDGIVPASRRYDEEFVAAVKAKAEKKAQ